ncbi:MAG: HAD hydrolase-like protein [Mariniphaga sp.]|nr:HAD hydrolase-like protein [Mariniphaga sp.]
MYPVSSIGDKLFKSLFQLIVKNGEYTGDFDEIKGEIMRRPFQFVADDFSFSENLKSECLKLFLNLTYDEHMEPFEDYKYVRQLPCIKFLVTTGFTKLQNSKILQLNIENDFLEIFIIDPIQSKLTKKDIFQKLLIDYRLKVHEVLVVGDDLNSEIKAANDIGIDAILYDRESEHAGIENQNTISSFKDLHLAY